MEVKHKHFYILWLSSRDMYVFRCKRGCTFFAVGQLYVIINKTRFWNKRL